MQRRQLLSRSMTLAAAGAASVAGPGLVGRTAAASTMPNAPVAAAMRAQQAIVPAGWDDGLAQPDTATAKLGAGLERGLVLGGGGVYLLSFYMGYVGTLLKNGIDLTKADIVVGTSAGSLTGTMLFTGMIEQFSAELDLLAAYPAMMSKMIQSGGSANPAQARAQQTYYNAETDSPENLLAIGRAAMSAHNPAGPDVWQEHVKLVLNGQTDWPSPKMHVTANDCDTMERLLITAASGVPAYVACAASSSMAGTNGPTWVKDRFCTDGGNCATDVHADVVTGVKKALIISICDGSPESFDQGLRVTKIQESVQQDIANLQKGGTETFFVVAGLPEGVEKVDSINDPKYITPMVTKGQQMAESDLDKLKAFWG
jgi:NTE family protein